MEKTIHNNMINLPSQRWKHSTSDFHNNLCVVTEHNGGMKLQSFLKHNDLTNKPTKQPTIKCLVILSNSKVQKCKHLNQYCKLEDYVVFIKMFKFIG